MNLRKLTLDELVTELSESHKDGGDLDAKAVKRLQKLRAETELVQAQIKARFGLDELNKLDAGLDKLIERIDGILVYYPELSA